MNGRYSFTLLLFATLGIEALRLGATPPTNDAFADRIQVQGDDVLLHAVLAESTLEQTKNPADGRIWRESFPISAEFGCGLLEPAPQLGSVWWSWIAPRSGTLLMFPEPRPETLDVLLLGPSLACFRSSSVSASNFVFRLPFYNPDGGQTMRHYGKPRYPFGGFYAKEGETYLFQSVGCAKGTYTFRLFMPRGPLLSEEPMDKVLLEGESAFLHVTATGSPTHTDLSRSPLEYQWLHGGIPLADQTYPCLALTSVSMSQAGNYQVVVSDAEGSVTSAVARVSVSLKETPPVLNIGSARKDQGGSLEHPTWILHGEAGRYYVIESSTNLIDWHWQSIDAVSPLADEPLVVTAAYWGDQKPSHVRIRHEPFAFRVVSPLGSLFLRARRMQPFDSTRATALWILQHAKEEFARDTRSPRINSDVPVSLDLVYRVHPELRPLLFWGTTECRMTVVLSSIGTQPFWPCLPDDLALWVPETYYLENPGLVWNPAH